MDAAVFIVLGCGALAVVGIILFLLSRSKARLAQVDTQAGEPFVLEACPDTLKPLRLWARYDMSWKAKADDFGLSFELDVQVEGEPSLNVQVGFGRMTVDDPGEYIAPVRRNVSRMGLTGDFREKATIPIYELGPRLSKSAISVRGVVNPSNGTVLNGATIFLAR